MSPNAETAAVCARVRAVCDAVRADEPVCSTSGWPVGYKSDSSDSDWITFADLRHLLRCAEAAQALADALRPFAGNEDESIRLLQRAQLRLKELGWRDAGAHEAVRRAMEFEHDGYRPFQDIYEARMTDWTYSYAWCCHAIVWAIQQYAAQRAKVEATP